MGDVPPLTCLLRFPTRIKQPPPAREVRKQLWDQEGGTAETLAGLPLMQIRRDEEVNAVMNEPVMDYMRRYRFKKLLLLDDADTELRAVIAIHSTALGPAGGGVRFLPYPSEKEAMVDAMRLARGMTYKYAAAGIDLGGGKAVIVGDPREDKSEALLRAFGRMVDQLGGEYYLAEDVGTTSEDAETIYKETGYVLSLPEHLGGPGDVAPLTALGSIEATRACAKRVWGIPDLAGRSVALQGLGAVGYRALRLLVESGARVVVADIEGAKVRQAQQEFGARRCQPRTSTSRTWTYSGPTLWER